MKRLFLVAAVLATTGSAMGQSTVKQTKVSSSMEKMEERIRSNKNRFLAPLNASIGQAKPTALQSRLKSVSFYSYNNDAYQLWDSLIFYWTDAQHKNSDEYVRYLLDGFVDLPNTHAFEPAKHYIAPYPGADSAHYYEQDMPTYNFKEIMQLNNMGLIDSMISLVKHGGDWEPLFKVDYLYTASGLPTSEINQEWDSSVWKNQARTLLDYDANNHVQSFKSEYWQADSNSWGDNGNVIRREFYTYDASGNLEEQVLQKHISGEWKNDERMTFSYANGQLVSEGIDFWDGAAQDWGFYLKGDLTYDANDRLIERYTKMWDGNNDIWMDDIKFLYSYNQNGDNDTILRQFNRGLGWENIDHFTYQYQQGKLIESVYYEWHSDTTYVPITKVSFTLNHHDQYTSALMQRWSDSLWSGTTNELLSKIQFGYEEFEDNTAIKEQETALNFTVYPNPANSYISVQMPLKEQINTVQIFDAQGKLVYSTKCRVHADQIRIPVHQLSAGSYFIQINSAGKRASRSFIVLK